jgi:hypothetical protein
MQKRLITQDDIYDVTEMADDIENYLGTLFNDNETNLVISALMSASVSTLIEKCKNLNECTHCRNIFILMFDATIRSAYPQEDKPSS